MVVEQIVTVLSELQISPALSVTAFSVITPSVWNLMLYRGRSAKLLSTFKRTLETKLFDIAYSEWEHSA